MDTQTAPRRRRRNSKSKKEWRSSGVWHRDGLSGITNFDFAIYCFMLHREQLVILPLKHVTRLGRARHEVVFEDPDDIVSKLEMEFANGGRCGEERLTPRTPAAVWSKAYAIAQRDLKLVMRNAERSNDAGSREGQPVVQHKSGPSTRRA